MSGWILRAVLLRDCIHCASKNIQIMSREVQTWWSQNDINEAIRRSNESEREDNILRQVEQLSLGTEEEDEDLRRAIKLSLMTPNTIDETASNLANSYKTAAKKALNLAQTCFIQQRGDVLCGAYALQFVLCIKFYEDYERKENIEETHRSFQKILDSNIDEVSDRDIGSYMIKGEYTITAIIDILQAYGIPTDMVSLDPTQPELFQTSIQSLTAESYSCYIVGTGGHWYVIVRIDNFWFKADSLYPNQPVQVCGMNANVRFFVNGFEDVKKEMKMQQSVVYITL